MSVRVSVRSHISKTTRSNFTEVFVNVDCGLAVARTFSGGVAICYVLQVDGYHPRAAQMLEVPEIVVRSL